MVRSKISQGKLPKQAMAPTKNVKLRTEPEEKEKLTIGLYFTRLREEAGLSLTEAAKRLKLPRVQNLYGMEHEQWTPGMVLIKRMSTVYVIPSKDIRIQLYKFKCARLKRKYGLK